MGSFWKARISRESKTIQDSVVAHRANAQGRLKARLYHFNIVTYGDSGKREIEELPTCRRLLCSKLCYGKDSSAYIGIFTEKKDRLLLIICCYITIYIIKPYVKNNLNE